MIQCDKCKAIQKSQMKSDEFISFINLHFCWVCWRDVCKVVTKWASEPRSEVKN